MTAPVPARDGATVMLVRDGDGGPPPLEVFMLHRHPRTAFGSIHVFPGGVLDPGDADPALAARIPDLTDADASRQLGIERGGLAFWVAAVREAFEEAGVLLARRRDGGALRLDHPDDVERFEDHRRSLHAGTRSMLEVLEAEDLVLPLADVRYWSHWITPESEPKRFDTRFFVARAPEGHAYLHDEVELIGSGWIRPADALERSRRGEFPIIYPTITSLEELDAAGCVADALGGHRPLAAGAPRGAP